MLRPFEIRSQLCPAAQAAIISSLPTSHHPFPRSSKNRTPDRRLPALYLTVSVQSNTWSTNASRKRVAVIKMRDLSQFPSSSSPTLPYSFFSLPRPLSSGVSWTRRKLRKPGPLKKVRWGGGGGWGWEEEGVAFPSTWTWVNAVSVN